MLSEADAPTVLNTEATLQPEIQAPPEMAKHSVMDISREAVGEMPNKDECEDDMVITQPSARAMKGKKGRKHSGGQGMLDREGWKDQPRGDLDEVRASAPPHLIADCNMLSVLQRGYLVVFCRLASILRESLRRITGFSMTANLGNCLLACLGQCPRSSYISLGGIWALHMVVGTRI